MVFLCFQRDSELGMIEWHYSLLTESFNDEWNFIAKSTEDKLIQELYFTCLLYIIYSN